MTGPAPILVVTRATIDVDVDGVEVEETFTVTALVRDAESGDADDISIVSVEGYGGSKRHLCDFDKRQVSQMKDAVAFATPCPEAA